MKLPVALQAEIERRIQGNVLNSSPVSGGCISNTSRIESQSGILFLKWTTATEPGAQLFTEEAKSLAALAAMKAVRVPRVVDVAAASGFAFILLEWLEPGSPTRKAWQELGWSLAELHRATNPRFGWTSDNFIGSLPQSNRERGSWPEFWREERMLPQLMAAAKKFSSSDRERLRKLIDETDSLLDAGDIEGASLLHGDLWSGNVHMLADGSPALIDPASYYGHREVDLAMSKLFGGFAHEFYTAYEEAWPLAPEAERRMLVYQLYYLLVHVNLFGGSYAANTMAVVKQLGF